MAVALLGIVINAVGLQRERHPAPLFAPEAVPAPASSAPAPILSTPAPAASQPKTEASPAPAAKPIASAAPQAPSRKADPIGDLVRTGAASESAKTVLAVQRALVKLGYDLNADGLMGASTVEALRDFEKNHGLPVTSELSPRLIAKLNGAAR
jgi:peptidoglycan hydrolase-like protein with peptidoglycan-binding domain